jgi:hypothetical protein
MWSTDGRSSPVCDGLLISVEWLKSTQSGPPTAQLPAHTEADAPRGVKGAFAATTANCRC